MTAYVIFDVTVNDLQGYEDYKRLAPLAISTYGGKYLARGGKSEILEKFNNEKYQCTSHGRPNKRGDTHDASRG